MTEEKTQRRFERATVALEVHYRTQGSFLISYSLNLSKGGLFLETTELLPVGSQLTIRFTIPGTALPVETSAVVMWVRHEPSEDGLPIGLGVQFDRLEERLGPVIDRLVQHFRGVRLMVLAGDSAAQERLSRNLRSILTAEVVPATAAQILVEGFGAHPDLVIVDLDSTASDGLAIIGKARQAAQPIPVIALSRSDESRAAALNAGAETALENPPPYELLRQRLLDLIGKPIQTN